MRHRIFVLLFFAAALLPRFVLAHGFEGDRFFPPTITTDDPFATDELNLPNLSIFEDPGTPQTEEVDASWEFDKEIFPKLALGVSDTYVHLKPFGKEQVQGWDNLEFSIKYQVLESAPREAIFSVGLLADVGGTGTRGVDDSFSTLTPTLYGGKGFGDLPDSLDALKPIAITGTLGFGLPTSTQSPDNVQVGLAFEYSLQYLQESVKDVGLPAPLKDMIPLVEVNLTDPVNRGQAGQTTGTINPGVLWETTYFQLGAEALIPVNSRTGEHVGAILNVQIFIDDIFPRIFGHPIFGQE